MKHIMKQISNTTLPILNENNKDINADLENEEINEVLLLSKKDCPMKLNEKRKMLNKILDHSLDIKEHSQLFDCDHSNANLYQFFEENLPKDKTRVLQHDKGFTRIKYLTNLSVIEFLWALGSH